MAYLVAIDIGGTFTDLAACDPSTGAIAFTKSPTTYDRLGDAIFDCIRKASLNIREASFVKHGTTLVINSLLQRSGATTALVTTQGFRDVLEIGRGNRTMPFNLRYQRDRVLIPRDMRFELSERMDATGDVLVIPSDAEIDDLAAKLKQMNVEAVAISFLNSYRNPAHEQFVAKRLKMLLPHAFVTTGSDLTREWHEFERTATAAANAYVGPQMSAYIRKFDDSLSEGGFDGALLLMGSHGGVISAERGCREPISLVESGPVGGCLGAAAYGQTLGLHNIVAFDMGGTTAKCALIERGRYATESTYFIGGPDTGFPIRGNVIDILEVGVGGGSIASLDDRMRLNVGPRSAGSMPGPACYGRGGMNPTVTDANLLLGRLDPHRFLGGEMSLDAAAAQSAMVDQIAAPLGYSGPKSGVEAAKGVLAIANLTMAGIIKKVSIARGYDPRDFVLFAYGGGGPLHAVDLARELGIPKIIIPPEPGNFSAMGMLLANPRLDNARTFVAPLDGRSITELTALYAALEDEARKQLLKEFGAAGDITFEREAEMRYRGQHHSIRLRVSGQMSAAEVRKLFDREYERRYGHANMEADVEFVAVRSLATLKMEQPELTMLARPLTASAGTPSHSRKINFADDGDFIDVPVYDRYGLKQGFRCVGPAIIEEYGSTTLVGPKDTLEIGAYREIVIDCGS